MTRATTADLAASGTRADPTFARAEDQAFAAYVRSGKIDTIARAAGVGIGASGGYVVPVEFADKVTETMKSFSAVRRLAEVTTTTTGGDLWWPTVNDTDHAGALLAENTLADEQDIEFGQNVLRAFAYTSLRVKVSHALAQDTGFDLEALLARALGRRIGRAQNPHFTTGNGSSQPEGFVSSGRIGATTAAATAILYDELVDLEHSVDADYREDPDACAWQFHDNVWKYIKKIRDDADRPIWTPPTATGERPRLLGYPVAVNNAMASTIAADAVTVAFGNWRAGYAIRDVLEGFTLARLTQVYADSFQLGYVGFARSDGLVQDAQAFALLKQHA